MELDDSIRQSRNDFGHSLSDLVLPTLINLTYTQKYDAVYELPQDVKSTPGELWPTWLLYCTNNV